MKDGSARDHCPNCGSAEVVSVTVLVVGQPLSATLCPACEWTEWSGDRQLAALDEVIGRVRRDGNAASHRAVS